MTADMRVPVLLICSVFFLQAVHAESLTDADRETLLDNLEKIRATSNSRQDARFRIALAAYRTAMVSDEAAMELYLNCMEKVNFEELHKKAADFREWKRKEAEKISDSGLRLALRYQLRWLMLTLEAASENADRGKLTGEAQDTMDAIFRDAEKLKNQQEILNQSVTSTVFAQAYDINAVKVENWPLSPVQVEAIYNEILLPPYRKPSGLAALQSGWIKLIKQESVKMELWSGRKDPNQEARGDKRIGMATDMLSPEYLKFLEEDVPKLQWKMEVDLFQHGDESGAALRMLAHLEKYIGHASMRDWTDQFKKLINPEAAPPKPKIEAEPTP